MLRCWWSQDESRPTWIASLQHTRTGQQLFFSSLDELYRFLKTEFVGELQSDPGDLPELNGTGNDSRDKTVNGQE
jgi:hypothetical protein